MPDKPEERDYSCSDEAMIVGIGTIAAHAKTHLEELAEEDTTLTETYIDGFIDRIDAAATGILGHDNAKALRDATAGLKAASDTALDTLSSVRNFIDTKYAADGSRRDELLRSLGFTELYTRAQHKDQQATGELLARAAAGLTKELQDELTKKGIAPARISTIQELAATYTRDNTGQETKKGGRKIATSADIKTLNALYNEGMAIAHIAQHLFRADQAKKDLFVFSKVVPASVRRSKSGDNDDGPAL